MPLINAALMSKLAVTNFFVTEGRVGEGGREDEDAVGGIRGSGVRGAIAGGRLAGSIDCDAGCHGFVGFLFYYQEAFQVDGVLFDVCHVD